MKHFITKKLFFLFLSLISITVNAQCPAGAVMNGFSHLGTCVVTIVGGLPNATVYVTNNGTGLQIGTGTTDASGNATIIISSCTATSITTMSFGAGNAVCVQLDNSVFVLPIKITNFSVSKLGNSNMLKWSVDNNSFGAQYIVERSIDGIQFLPIHDFYNSVYKQNSFNYQDDFTNNDAIVYYRLKIINVDKNISYSNIVKTNNNKLSDIEIYPNPVVKELNFNVSNTFLGGNYKIYNNSGSLLKSGSVINLNQHVDFEAGKGIYYLKVIGKNQSIISKTFVVQ